MTVLTPVLSNSVTLASSTGTELSALDVDFLNAIPTDASVVISDIAAGATLSDADGNSFVATAGRTSVDIVKVALLMVS